MKSRSPPSRPAWALIADIDDDDDGDGDDDDDDDDDVDEKLLTSFSTCLGTCRSTCRHCSRGTFVQTSFGTWPAIILIIIVDIIITR